MKLIIPLKSYVKMIQYCNAVESEISGLADVEYDEKGENFVMGEVYLIKQTATEGTVDLIDESVHSFMFERIKQGAKRTPRIWWHSHYNFQTFFSSTDEATIQRLKTDTFIIAICANQMGDLHAKAIISSPIPKIIENLEIEIQPKHIKIFKPSEEIEEDVKSKVQKETPESLATKLGNWVKDIATKEEANEETLIGDELKIEYKYLPENAEEGSKLIAALRLEELFDPDVKEFVWGGSNLEVLYRIKKGSELETFLNKNG